jgi:RNA polymerase sigma-54 factor
MNLLRCSCPGSRFNPTQSQCVIPDVYVVKVEDQYVAVLNEDGLPQMRISPVYRRLLDKGADNSDETRAYVKDKFRSALWLIKSVEQRQKTIHKVANSIINFQTVDEFPFQCAIDQDGELAGG